MTNTNTQSNLRLLISRNKREGKYAGKFVFSWNVYPYCEKLLRIPLRHHRGLCAVFNLGIKRISHEL